MRKERLEIVETVRDRLHESEIAVETALTAIARLTASLPEARLRANISPVAGQDAFTSLGTALAGIIGVRGALAAAHTQLDHVREQFRLPVVQTGGGYEKPPREGISVVEPLGDTARIAA